MYGNYQLIHNIDMEGFNNMGLGLVNPNMMMPFNYNEENTSGNFINFGENQGALYDYQQIVKTEEKENTNNNNNGKRTK
jgi:hypothetical protein